MILKIFLFVFITNEIGLIEVKSTSEIEGKVFLGSKVKHLEDFPYVFQLLFHNSLICGCSGISKKIVITAAHCVYNLDNNLEIIAGSLEKLKGGQRIKVEMATIHPKYENFEYDYDVAVLRLGKELKLSRQVRNVKLIDYPVPINKFVWAAGWGVYKYTNNNVTNDSLFSDTLRYVLLRICDLSKCQKNFDLYPPYHHTTDRMICAGYRADRRNLAFGDAGGPLMLYQENIQVGIASWGAGTAGMRFSPFTYTNISHSEIYGFINKFLNDTSSSTQENLVLFL